MDKQQRVQRNLQRWLLDCQTRTANRSSSSSATRPTSITTSPALPSATTSDGSSTTSSSVQQNVTSPDGGGNISYGDSSSSPPYLIVENNNNDNTTSSSMQHAIDEIRSSIQEGERRRMEQEHYSELTRENGRLKTRIKHLEECLAEKRKKEQQHPAKGTAKISSDTIAAKSSIMMVNDDEQHEALERKFDRQKNKTAHTSKFPSGEELVLRTTRLQEYCCDFLDDIADLLDASVGENASNRPLHSHHKVVLTHILVPCSVKVSHVVDSWIQFKTDQLNKFVGDESGSNSMNNDDSSSSSSSSLYHVFWTFTMQRLATKFRQAVPNKAWNVKFLKEELRQHPYLAWVHREDIVKSEHMDNKNVQTLIDNFFLLSFECAVSGCCDDSHNAANNKRTTLFPKMGDSVSFSKEHHEQFFYSESAIAKSGDRVHVVFPGLYQGNPEDDSASLVPAVKAKVVFFREIDESSKASRSFQEPWEAGGEDYYSYEDDDDDYDDDDEEEEDREFEKWA